MLEFVVELRQVSAATFNTPAKGIASLDVLCPSNLLHATPLCASDRRERGPFLTSVLYYTSPKRISSSGDMM